MFICIRVAGVTRMMAKSFEKNNVYFGHRGPFLVLDGPPLALPGSVLTPSTSPRPGLDRPTSDNDLFDSIFPEKIKKIHFLDPFGPSFTPLEVKI